MYFWLGVIKEVILNSFKVSICVSGVFRVVYCIDSFVDVWFGVICIKCKLCYGYWGVNYEFYIGVVFVDFVEIDYSFN